MKARKVFLMAMMMAGISVTSTIAYAEDTDYSYLEDMSVKELKALDAAIHEILGNNADETVDDAETETEVESVHMKEEDFYNDILASYSARDEISDKYTTSEINTLSEEEYQQWRKDLVDAEWSYMEKYQNATFDDLNIQYLCKQYVDGLINQKKSYQSYMDGDSVKSDDQWTAGYNKRSYVIVELAEYFDIPFPADGVENMKQTTEGLDSLDEAETRNSEVSTEKVKEVQTLLHEIGFKCWNIDGVAGKKTVRAIKRFQEMYGYKTDGLITDELIEELKQVKTEKGLDGTSETDAEDGTE